MKLRRLLLILGLILSLIATTACSGNPADSTQASTADAPKEIPTLNVCWSNELHTGNMHLNFIKPELFENNPVHLKPVSDSQFELIKDGNVIANINFVRSKSGAEAVTLMTQGHMDLAYGSSTAFLSGYDAGLDVSILGPIQSGGVSIVAAIDAPYNTFEELVEYAKNSKKPILGGYHSAVSSPRIVLEYALRDAGLKVTEDTADYSADVVLTDLKGISNLIPSLSSGQVELWAGPVPNPQNAEAQKIGKIIATLEELPGGKWVDFPCCTINVRNDIKEKYPEVTAAMFQVTTDVSRFAQENREETAELMTEFIGLEKGVLVQNDTTYTTKVTDHFTDGMETYYEAMSAMGKFTGRLKDKSPDEVMKAAFDFSFSEAINK